MLIQKVGRVPKIRAGVKVRLAAMATATATSPPAPIALTSCTGVISKQAKQHAKITPACATIRPDVERLIAMASAAAAPAAVSFWNLLKRNKA